MNNLGSELQIALPSLITIDEDGEKFISFINDSKYVTIPDNPTSHICSFFLPVHLPSKSMYLVHHKKAKDWIPPGGHIEKGEHPVQTVKREFNEELGITLTNQKIELFALSIKDVYSPNRACKTHYDLWYAVYFNDIVPFQYDREEFFDANWFSFKDSTKQTKIEKYSNILSQFIAAK